MKNHPDSDSRGLWAIAWRMVVYLPCMLGVFLLLLSVVLSLVLLPLFGAIYFYFGLWWQGAVAFAAWLVLMGCYRHFRMARFLGSPPSYL